MRLKRILTLSIVCLGIATHAYAQFGVPNLLKYDKRRFHFGFTLGYNNFNYRISSKPDLAEYDSLMLVHTRPMSGFSLGIVTNLRLGKYFDLRFIPGLSFGDRYIDYTVRYPDGSEIITPKNVESVYLDLPILFKYKSSRMLNNIRAYVIAGGQYTFDMISAKKRKAPANGDIVVKLNPHDVQAQVGVGFDFYCTYFKFSTELKMSFGFINMLVPEDNMYATSVTGLHAKNLQISFIFE
ncbi:MAG: PorT family protein [Bacteroidales bacterium]|jgi:hypothetical protein|nr:PorT family protein [Bacteroidales bacterium]